MNKPTIFVLIVLALSFINVNAEKVTIINVNDTHSALTSGGERTKDLKGTLGGISRFANFVKKTRDIDTATIVLHAGDFSIGDIMYCNYLGIAELGLLNTIGVDAITLGNHEFDLTPAMLTFVLENGLTDSDIKILCANGNFDGTPDLKKYIHSNSIFTANGVKVGVFGVTTPNTAILSQPDPVTFEDEALLVQTIHKNVDYLQGEGCKIIIMLSHLGYWTDLALTESIYGIDAIIGGHDHYLINESYPLVDEKDCLIVQAGAYYSHAGKIEFDLTDGVVSEVNYILNELNSEDETDPTTDMILDAMIEEVESKYGPVFTQEIAVATETFSEVCEDLLTPGFKDTEVANLACDAFKAFGGTDIGITASGFTANPIYKGPLVGNDLYRAIGYGFNAENTLGYKLVKFDIKGSDIWAGISFGLQYIAFFDDYIIQCSENMRYKYAATMLEGMAFPIGILDWVLINGQPLDTNKIYSVTANEGIAMFLYQLNIEPKNLTYFENDVTEYMAIYDYVSKKKTISPRERGRINDVETENNPVYSLNTKAFPNPANSTTSLEFNVENEDFFQTYIYDMQGKPIIKTNGEFFNNGLNSINVNVSQFSAGSYTYIITNGTQRFIGKFAIQR